jgi:hypothetical protein
VSLTPNSPLDPVPDQSAEALLPESLPVPRPKDPPWGIPAVLLIAAFDFIALNLIALPVFMAIHAIPRFHQLSLDAFLKSAFALIPLTLSYLLTLFFMMLVVQRGSDQPFFVSVKWRWPEKIYPYIALGIGTSVVIQFVSNFLPIPKSLPIDEFFKSTHAAWALAIFGVVVAPFFEELFFRGFLYPALYRRVGFLAASVVNSLLFAFTHEGQLAHAWAPLLVLFVVGMVLTYVRERTGSVASSFLVHASYNALLFGMIFVVTNGFRHMEKLR